MSMIAAVRRDFEVVKSLLPVLLAARKAAADKTIDYSDFLDSHFRRRANHPALIGESGSMTWGELDAFANRIAHWALSEGLSRGDVVALLMENRPEFIGIWLGLSQIGVVSALMNTNLTGDRLAHCMREAAACHFIVGVEMAEAAASAVTELSDVPKVLVTGAIAAPIEASAAIPASLSQVAPDARPFDGLHARQSAAAVDPSVRAGRLGGDGIFLIYTSGTTGLPKAARISHTKAILTGIGSWKSLGLTPNDRTYCCLPLYHSAGGHDVGRGCVALGGHTGHRTSIFSEKVLERLYSA